MKMGISNLFSEEKFLVRPIMCRSQNRKFFMASIERRTYKLNGKKKTPDHHNVGTQMDDGRW
jgi:hypothetical protein